MNTTMLDLNTVVLKRGLRRVDGEFCAVQAAHVARGLPKNDSAADDECPMLVWLLIRLNDAYGDGEEADKERTEAVRAWLPRLAGSRLTSEDRRRRACALADVTCRELIPSALSLRGQHAHASIMAGLPPIVDRESAQFASDAAYQVRDELREIAYDAAAAAAYADAAAYAAADAYAAAYAAADAYAAAAADPIREQVMVESLKRLLEAAWSVQASTQAVAT